MNEYSVYFDVFGKTVIVTPIIADNPETAAIFAKVYLDSEASIERVTVKVVKAAE